MGIYGVEQPADKIPDKIVNPVIYLLEELLGLFDNVPLDIEFAITKNQRNNQEQGFFELLQLDH